MAQNTFDNESFFSLVNFLYMLEMENPPSNLLYKKFNKTFDTGPLL